MLDAIVYCSKCGHTKCYAFKLAEELHLPIFSLNEAKKKLKKESYIFYLGWVCENKIVGFDQLYQFHIEAIAAVGIMPYSEERIKCLKEENQLNSGLFYLRGGIQKRLLSLRQRWILYRIKKYLIFKKSDNGLTKDEEEVLECLIHQNNKMDFNSLEPIINYYGHLEKIEYYS